MHYLTFVFTDAGGYSFTAPDVLGFTAHAETEDFDEAVMVARQVLTHHLASLIDAGGELPRARSLAELRADPELVDDFAEAATTIMLPAVVPFGRTKRVNLSIDENTLDLIDKAAHMRGLTRSAFIAEAARQYAS